MQKKINNTPCKNREKHTWKSEDEQFCEICSADIYHHVRLRRIFDGGRNVEDAKQIKGFG